MTGVNVTIAVDKHLFDNFVESSVIADFDFGFEKSM